MLWQDINNEVLYGSRVEAGKRMTWDRTRETVLAVKDVGCSGNYRPSRFANYFLSGSIKNAAYYIVQGPQAILQALQSLGVPLCLSFGIYFSSFGLSGFRKFKAAVIKSGTRAKGRKPANTLAFKTVWLTAIFKWIGKWIKGEMIYMTRCSSGFFFKENFKFLLISIFIHGFDIV